MNRKIRGFAYRIAFDEVNSRFFLLSERSVRAFDMKTAKKIAKFEDVDKPNQIFISHKNGIIAVKSIDGQFFFYSANDLSFLGKIRMKGLRKTDSDFCYDEEENAIYGLSTKSAKNGVMDFGIYRVFPKTLTYSAIPLRQLECEVKDGEKPGTFYEFHKYSQGSFYLIRNLYAVGNGRTYESCYGRYEEEGGALVLKEKIISTTERRLELLDVTEKENVAKIDDFCKKLSAECGKYSDHADKDGAFGIAFDNVNSRCLIINERSVCVINSDTYGVIATLKDLDNPCRISISHKNGIIAVKSTEGQFAFYSVKDLSLLGKVSISGSPDTDYDLYYDEEENALYGLAKGFTKETGFFVYRVCPKTLTYSAIPLPHAESEELFTRYKFHRHSQGSFYLIRNSYDFGHGRIYESCYGRYEEEGGALVLKEKCLSAVDRQLDLDKDSNDKDVFQINLFGLMLQYQGIEYLSHTYRNERGLFLITSEAVYHLGGSGKFEELYRARGVSDYAEIGGRSYICTLEACVVQDIIE